MLERLIFYAFLSHYHRKILKLVETNLLKRKC